MGPVRLGSVEPNMATVGTPRDAAMCMGPLSFVTNRTHLSKMAMLFLRSISPARFIP